MEGGMEGGRGAWFFLKHRALPQRQAVASQPVKAWKSESGRAEGVRQMRKEQKRRHIHTSSLTHQHHLSHTHTHTPTHTHTHSHTHTHQHTHTTLLYLSLSSPHH